MNRRRMMMAQQSKEFKLVYDAAAGVSPLDTGDWTSHKITAHPSISMGDDYFIMQLNAYGQNGGLTPSNRMIGKSANMSIGASIKIGHNWFNSFTLIATNGDKAAMVKFLFDGEAKEGSSWVIQVHNGTKLSTVGTKQVDALNSFVDLELVITGGTYTFYINGEAFYTDNAIDHSQLQTIHENYNCNLLANTSNTLQSWYVSKMNYKEW